MHIIVLWCPGSSLSHSHVAYSFKLADVEHEIYEYPSNARKKAWKYFGLTCIIHSTNVYHWCILRPFDGGGGGGGWVMKEGFSIESLLKLFR